MRVVALRGLRPRRPRHSFERQDPHLFRSRLLDDLRSEVRLREEDKINREQNRIKVKAIHCRQSHLYRMRRKADESHLTCLPGGLEGLHSAIRAKYLIEFRHLGQTMKLI